MKDKQIKKKVNEQGQEIKGYQVQTYNSYDSIEQQVTHYEEVFTGPETSFDDLKKHYKDKYVMSAQANMEINDMSRLMLPMNEGIEGKISRYESLSKDDAELRRLSKSRYSKNSTSERRKAFQASKADYEKVQSGHGLVVQEMNKFINVSADTKRCRAEVDQWEERAETVQS